MLDHRDLFWPAVFLLLALSIVTPAHAELKMDQLDVPDGFKIEVWAEVPDARTMVVGDGFVVVGTQQKSVYAVPFDEAMQAGEVVTVADDLSVPNGLALLDGVLYIAEQPRLIRWGDAPFDPASPKQDPVQIGPGLHDEWHHGWRYMEVDSEGRLYIAIGSPCNVCMPQGMQGTIIRLNSDGSAAGGEPYEIFARGIRNSVGMDWSPVNGDLYFTDNGADMMGDNTPPEELNRITEKGQHFGYPYFGGSRAKTKEFGRRELPEDVQFPVQEFQAHTAGLGFDFYEGDMFPASYRNDVILAQHGSWNRTFPVGYRLMRVRFDDEGNAIGKEVFVDGWLKRGRDWGRPVDVKELPDGSLLVSDDKAGVLYRITYDQSSGGD